MQSSDGLIRSNDIAVLSSGEPHQSVVRYHLALSGLAGRGGLRNEVSRYEAVALTLVDVEEDSLGRILSGFPPPDDPLHFDHLLPTIYKQYDLRYVYQAPDLKKLTFRRGWAEDSPALLSWSHGEYAPRLLDEEHGQ